MAILQLGGFAFETSSILIAEIEKSRAARFERTQRYRANSAVQYCGPGEETISLPFVIYDKAHGNIQALKSLYEMMESGEAHLLVTGEGDILGNFTIERISEKQSELWINGKPRKADGTIELMKV